MNDTKSLVENISFKKLRILERKNGRMKLSFNLSTEEATAFKNFFTAINVNNNTEEEFIKAAFILGLRSMEQSVLEKMKTELEKAEAEKAEGISSDSVEFVEEEAKDKDDSTED